MNNFYLIDKPSGMTSFEVLRKMRRILGVRRIGHIGTLDPLATGCLLVATGEYTKCISLLEGQDKSYTADIMLNGSSPSYDSDTQVEYISQAQQNELQKNLKKEDIESLLSEHFLGEVSQIPPKYSALKIDGKRALDRILAGEELEMKARTAKIYKTRVQNYIYPLLQVDISVSSGTYIRSIAHDLGQKINSGGYLSALRRTSIGHLDISSAVALEAITTDFGALSLEDIFGDKCILFQDEAVYKRLSDGQRVSGDFSFPKDINFLLFDGNSLRYIVEYKGGVIHPRKKILHTPSSS